jgi:hypothetical protein
MLILYATLLYSTLLYSTLLYSTLLYELFRNVIVDEIVELNQVASGSGLRIISGTTCHPYWSTDINSGYGC